MPTHSGNMAHNLHLALGLIMRLPMMGINLWTFRLFSVNVRAEACMPEAQKSAQNYTADCSTGIVQLQAEKQHTWNIKLQHSLWMLAIKYSWPVFFMALYNYSSCQLFRDLCTFCKTMSVRLMATIQWPGPHNMYTPPIFEQQQYMSTSSLLSTSLCTWGDLVRTQNNTTL
jgi:hypothetical protein